MKILSTMLFGFSFLLISGCSNENGLKSKIEGKWVVYNKPKWVDKGQEWTFLPEGVCVLGNASGKYEISGESSITVQMPMQEATMGFIGVFHVNVDDDEMSVTSPMESGTALLARVPRSLEHWPDGDSNKLSRVERRQIGKWQGQDETQYWEFENFQDRTFVGVTERKNGENTESQSMRMTGRWRIEGDLLDYQWLTIGGELLENPPVVTAKVIESTPEKFVTRRSDGTIVEEFRIDNFTLEGWSAIEESANKAE